MEPGRRVDRSGRVWVGRENAERGTTIAAASNGRAPDSDGGLRVDGSVSGLAAASSYPVVAWTRTGSPHYTVLR